MTTTTIYPPREDEGAVQIAKPERPFEILGQYDGKRFSVAFGIHPDRRHYSVKTRRLNKSRSTFIHCWAFTLVFIRWAA